MKLGTLLALLVEKQAWFPSVHSLRAGDPFEGSLAERFHMKLWSALESAGHGGADTKEWLRQSLPEDMQRFLELNHDYPGLSDHELGRAYFEALAKRRAVWCWYASDIESAAMWAIYGPQGVSVMTDQDRLEDALNSKADFHIRKMAYVDRRSCSPRYVGSVLEEERDLVFRPYFLKAVEYEHEKELRVATYCPKGFSGRMVQDIDPRKLIREIVISPLIPTNEARAIIEVIRKLIPEVEVKQSTLISEDRRIGFSETMTHAIGNALFREELSSLPQPLRTL